ncbi:DNA polymerase [Phyllobacterium endophyticum]|uniref:DNA polymerase n=1 Tax=Phyllobacterium endophyticum TaxID=1149773 RepID=UPI0011CB6A55|nr:DNA polymerase [Phyllobacterium endophyticum]TXR49904.1 DNA polymerase [Phyllobacterium endophyticum]
MLPLNPTKEWLYWDTETNGLLDTVSVIHCVVILDLKTGKIDAYRPHQIEDALRRVMAAEYITGHNIVRYDIPVCQKLYPWFKPMGKVTDTLITSSLIWSNLRRDDYVRLNQGTSKLPKHLCGRQSLEAWGYRMGENKGDYSKTVKDLSKEYAEKGIEAVPEEYRVLASIDAKGNPCLDPWLAFNEPMLVYCVQDCRTGFKLWNLIKNKKPSPKAVRLEHDIASIIMRMEANGVGFDEINAAKLYGVLATRRDLLLEECRTLFPRWIVRGKLKTVPRDLRRGVKEYGKTVHRRFHKTTGKELSPEHVFNVYETRFEGSQFSEITVTEFNPGSRAHVADRLQAIYGWIPTEFNSPEDEDEDGGENGKPKVNDEILSALQYPAAKSLAEYFMVTKRLGMLSEGKNAWLRHTVNGKIFGKLNPQGTPTGRATHSKPNLGQVPSITNAKGTVPYGKECRALFKPTRKGWLQVGADASGLELRCLGHELYPYDDGAYADIVLNGDIHWVNAIALGLIAPGTQRDKHNKTHEDARAIAKRFIYAFLYGGGPEMIGSIAGVDEEEVHRWGHNKRVINTLVKNGRHPDPALVAVIVKGQKLMEKFLANLPALKALKTQIAADLKANGNHLVGLDGRMLPSRSAHSALNLLLQSDGAIICKRWIVQFMTDMEAEGYRIDEDFALMLWVHDEIQVEARTQEIADAVARIAKAAVPKVGDFFDFKVKLDGDALIGNNWADCH